MSHRTTTRTLTTIATAGLAGLLLAAPATARPDPGTGGRDLVPGSSQAGSELAVGGSTPLAPMVVTVDDDAFEVLQVGAGLLAGLSLAGAGAALVSRRHHRVGHPA